MTDPDPSAHPPTVTPGDDTRDDLLTAGDSDNPIRALNTHGQTGTCLEHGSQLSSGKGHAGISPQASGQRDQGAERPAVSKSPLSRDEGSVTPERTTNEEDHGAGLIGQPIPDMAGTEPRPYDHWRAGVEAAITVILERAEHENHVCQPGMWFAAGHVRQQLLGSAPAPTAEPVGERAGAQRQDPVASQPVREERQQK